MSSRSSYSASESWASDNDDSDSALVDALQRYTDGYISSTDDEILCEAVHSYEVTAAANEVINAIRELNSHHSPPPSHSTSSTTLNPQPSTSSDGHISGLLF